MINWIIKLWNKYQNYLTYEFVLNYIEPYDKIILIILHTDEYTGLKYQVAKIETDDDDTVVSEGIIIGHVEQVKNLFNEIKQKYADRKRN